MRVNSNFTQLQPMGYRALIDKYALQAFPHYRASYITPHARVRTMQKGNVEIQFILKVMPLLQ